MPKPSTAATSFRSRRSHRTTEKPPRSFSTKSAAEPLVQRGQQGSRLRVRRSLYVAGQRAEFVLVVQVGIAGDQQSRVLDRSAAWRNGRSDAHAGSAGRLAAPPAPGGASESPPLIAASVAAVRSGLSVRHTAQIPLMPPYRPPARS